MVLRKYQKGYVLGHLIPTARLMANARWNVNCWPHCAVTVHSLFMKAYSSRERVKTWQLQRWCEYINMWPQIEQPYPGSKGGSIFKSVDYHPSWIMLLISCKGNGTWQCDRPDLWPLTFRHLEFKSDEHTWGIHISVSPIAYRYFINPTIWPKNCRY